MAPTFSLAQTAIISDALPAPVADFKIADSMVPSGSLTLSTATIPAMQAAMRNNTPVLAKGPDGSLLLYTLDAERSTPTVPVLKPVV